MDIFCRSKRNGKPPDVKRDSNAAGNQTTARIDVWRGVALVAKGELEWFAAIPGNLPQVHGGQVKNSGTTGTAEHESGAAWKPGEAGERRRIEGHAPGNAARSGNVKKIIRPTIIGKHESDGGIVGGPAGLAAGCF
ncbi:MAG TPA: hypothetical protein VKB66_10765 [Candidatus Acidoferrum sp.]|nr:hypothetical protein [Candidatus Acidoferrum sp.]